MNILQDEQKVSEAMAEYGATKSGILASSGPGNCFASYAALSFQEEIEAIKQSVFSPDSPTRYPGAAKGLLADALASPDNASIHIAFIAATINLEAFPSQSGMLKPPASMKSKAGISFTISAQRPLSVGSCHILSNHPEDDSAIDPAYISHPANLEVPSNGVELAERMRTTSPFKEKIKRGHSPLKLFTLGRKRTDRIFESGDHYSVSSCWNCCNEPRGYRCL